VEDCALLRKLDGGELGADGILCGELHFLLLPCLQRLLALMLSHLQ
jgi:hypothetical protein